jgi:Na+-transporting methylmalonyl-CoA/oxaloacetate decarboxylase gamma subunit
LYSIDNITAANGWAMAAVGASIVFLGLVILSFVISQMHKILRFWEDRGIRSSRAEEQAPAAKAPEPEAPAYKELHVPEVSELADTYGPLVDKMGDSFELTQLFVIAKENDFPHPHLSINRLREAGILVAQDDGTFTWKKP